MNTSLYSFFSFISFYEKQKQSQRCVRNFQHINKEDKNSASAFMLKWNTYLLLFLWKLYIGGYEAVTNSNLFIFCNPGFVKINTCITIKCIVSTFWTTPDFYILFNSFDILYSNIILGVKLRYWFTRKLHTRNNRTVR